MKIFFVLLIYKGKIIFNKVLIKILRDIVIIVYNGILFFMILVNIFGILFLWVSV